jgi:flagellar biosynthesis protein FlhB
MADDRPSGEPTEPPSEKRLRDARARGEVAQSRELTGAAVFLGAGALLAWTWPTLIGQLRGTLATALQLAPARLPSPASALDAGLRGLTAAALPLLLGAFLLALLAGFAQVGPLLSLHPLLPSLRRLDPSRNLGRVLGGAALLELCKTVVKIAGIGYVAASALWDQLPRILATLGGPPEALLDAVAGGAGAIAARAAIVVALIAVADLLYQRYAFRRRLRMTKAEVQREQKESEGDPHHKAERRRVHREIAEHQMLEQVARADCVIINPEHVAVAIRYDAAAMGAPRVVARGQRLMAARIREIARQSGVPIVRNVPLARALVELELDQEIPPELYEAVAEVLRFVYDLSLGTRGGEPPRPGTR